MHGLGQGVNGLSRVWRIAPWPPGAGEFAARLGVPPLMGALLLGRGLDLAEAPAFLRPDPGHFHDPFTLPDMDRAVERLLRAVRDGERILVWGDYDVDGITATCIMMEALHQLGARHVECYIPHRVHEGYGLHGPTLSAWARSGVSLVITVDCGVQDHQVLSDAARWGLDVIVTDHHRCPDRLPPAIAVVSAQRGDSRYRFPHLSGAGVAFKVMQALSGYAGSIRPETALDLVALGTIADVVPLVGENRVLARLGLEVLNHSLRPGLEALSRVAGVTGALDAERVAFGLAPRLNAAGRVDRADSALRLLMSQDPVQAGILAGELDQHNRRRQALEEAILEDVRRAAPGLKDQRVLVLAGSGWHPGVLGIVASRLVDAYWRPVVLVGLEGGRGRGSARSIPGFDMYEALQACSRHLTQFGGHTSAAGLSLDAGAVEGLRDELNRLAMAAPPETLLPVLDIDAEVSLADLSLTLLEAMATLAPHGAANNQPVFMVRDVQVEGVRRLGQNGHHLGFNVHDRHGCAVPAVAFRAGARTAGLDGRVDLAFCPVLDTWRGTRRLRLMVQDWRPAGDGGPGECLYAAVSALGGGESWPAPAVPWVSKGTLPALVDRRRWSPGQVLADLPDVARLVWALDETQARELAGTMRGRGLNAQYYGATLPFAYRQYIEESFEQGRIAALVSPDPGEWWPTRPVTAVWCTPPPTPAVFSARSARAVQVILAFGAGEVTGALSYWRALVPDREWLATVYRILLGQEKKLRRPVPLARARDRMEKEFPGLGRALLGLSLEVFGELRLAAVEMVDGEEAVILLPAPRTRLELEHSPTYARLRQEWSEAGANVARALDGPLSTYRRWLENQGREC